VASQPSSRKAFIDSSINISRSYNFHGLDINWEFPGTATDMSNFGILPAEWRASVSNESQKSGRPPLLLLTAFVLTPHLNVKFVCSFIRLGSLGKDNFSCQKIM
ncbi:unnamed protein product, partial [Prunus brigantina]